MKVITIVLAFASLFYTVISDFQDYPVLVPSSARPFMQGFASLPYPQWSITRRAWGVIPQTCLVRALGQGACNRYNVYIYDIKFSDVSDQIYLFQSLKHKAKYTKIVRCSLDSLSLQHYNCRNVDYRLR